MMPPTPKHEAAVNASGQILYDWNPATNTLTHGGDVQRILGYSTAEMARGVTSRVWVILGSLGLGGSPTGTVY